MSTVVPRLVVRPDSGACFEFVAWDTAAARGAALPVQPGAVRRDAAGRAALLHVGPLRWLVPIPAAALQAQLAGLERAGAGSLVDVDGKWAAVTLNAELARPILESTLNVELVLGERDCAAVMLFDCPAILARIDDAFELWIASSYAESFSSTVGGLVLTGR